LFLFSVAGPAENRDKSAGSRSGVRITVAYSCGRARA
jgi:hypothetical protein